MVRESAIQAWNWDAFLEEEEVYVNRLEECVKETIRPMKDHGFVRSQALATVFEAVQDIRDQMVTFVTAATNLRYEDPTDTLLQQAYFQALQQMTRAYHAYADYYILAMSQFIELAQFRGVKALLALPTGSPSVLVGKDHWQSYLPTPAHRLNTYWNSLRLLASQSCPETGLLMTDIEHLRDQTTGIFGRVNTWQQLIEALISIDLGKHLGTARAKSLMGLYRTPAHASHQSLAVLLDDCFTVLKVYKSSHLHVGAQTKSMRLVLLPELFLLCVPTTPAEQAAQPTKLWKLATSHVARGKIQVRPCTNSGELSLVLHGKLLARLMCSAEVSARWDRLLEVVPMRWPQSAGSQSFTKRFTSFFTNRKSPPESFSCLDHTVTEIPVMRSATVGDQTPDATPAFTRPLLKKSYTDTHHSNHSATSLQVPSPRGVIASHLRTVSSAASVRLSRLVQRADLDAPRPSSVKPASGLGFPAAAYSPSPLRPASPALSDTPDETLTIQLSPPSLQAKPLPEMPPPSLAESPTKSLYERRSQRVALTGNRPKRLNEMCVTAPTPEPMPPLLDCMVADARWQLHSSHAQPWASSSPLVHSMGAARLTLLGRLSGQYNLAIADPCAQDNALCVTLAPTVQLIPTAENVVTLMIPAQAVNQWPSGVDAPFPSTYPCRTSMLGTNSHTPMSSSFAAFDAGIIVRLTTTTDDECQTVRDQLRTGLKNVLPQSTRSEQIPRTWEWVSTTPPSPAAQPQTVPAEPPWSPVTTHHHEALMVTTRSVVFANSCLVYAKQGAFGAWTSRGICLTELLKQETLELTVPPSPSSASTISSLGGPTANATQLKPTEGQGLHQSPPPTPLSMHSLTADDSAAQGIASRPTSFQLSAQGPGLVPVSKEHNVEPSPATGAPSSPGSKSSNTKSLSVRIRSASFASIQDNIHSFTPNQLHDSRPMEGQVRGQVCPETAITAHHCEPMGRNRVLIHTTSTNGEPMTYLCYFQHREYLEAFMQGLAT
ncbi:hypothetical protein H4R35_001502 [Dimargaris xerosporica]|nr:hypothetical protein H4R35_001502 [Dimargaris xerosporica]